MLPSSHSWECPHRFYRPLINLADTLSTSPTLCFWSQPIVSFVITHFSGVPGRNNSCLNLMMLNYSKCNSYKADLARIRKSCCSFTPPHTLLLRSHHTILQVFCLFFFLKVLKAISSGASVLLEGLAFGLWSGQLLWIALMERRASRSVGLSMG